MAEGGLSKHGPETEGGKGSQEGAPGLYPVSNWEGRGV